MSGIGQLFNSLNVSASGMNAQRFRMDIAAQNLAGARATRENGEAKPYTRRTVYFEAVFQDALKGDPISFRGQGVRVAEVVPDSRPALNAVMGNGDMPEEGSNVTETTEMLDLMDASRSYQANATAFRMTRQMLQRTVDLGRA